MINKIKFFIWLLSHPVNKSQKIKALIRYLRWQFGSMLLDADVVYPWIGSSRFIVKKGETGLTCNIYAGLQEFNDMAFLLHFLRKGDFFVDVGANVGAYSILAAKVCEANVMAYEPIPSTFARLVNNIKINNIESLVESRNKGVGAEQGSLFFTTDGDTVNHVVSKAETNVSKVEVQIDILDVSLANKEPVLMKVDVEGFELNVIKGALSLLNTPSLKAIILELNGSGNRYGFDEEEIVNMLNKNDFYAYSYDPFERSLNKIHHKNYCNGNTLFLKGIDFIEPRIKSSVKLCIRGMRI